MTVRQLAEKVGLSASFLYQLEQDKTSPSFSTLKGIAAALNTNITLLVEDSLPEEWLIVRNNNYKRIVTGNPGMELNLLTFLGHREKRMQPMVFELASRCFQRGHRGLPGQGAFFIYPGGGSRGYLG
ncbi:MAG: helix-turn-helix transcriptional regulator [Candidatus Syntrophopropionicum ammoniitolerans]